MNCVIRGQQTEQPDYGRPPTECTQAWGIFPAKYHYWIHARNEMLTTGLSWWTDQISGHWGQHQSNTPPPRNSTIYSAGTIPFFFLRAHEFLNILNWFSSLLSGEHHLLPLPFPLCLSFSRYPLISTIAGGGGKGIPPQLCLLLILGNSLGIGLSTPCYFWSQRFFSRPGLLVPSTALSTMVFARDVLLVIFDQTIRVFFLSRFCCHVLILPCGTLFLSGRFLDMLFVGYGRQPLIAFHFHDVILTYIAGAVVSDQ